MSSTELPTISHDVRRSPPGTQIEVGGVTLQPGKRLLLTAEDYAHGSWLRYPPLVIEISFIGDLVVDGEHILIEGYQQDGERLTPRVLAIRVDALKPALLD